MPVELNLHHPASLAGELNMLPCRDTLSQTDLKTYAVVILSYLLIGIGIALAGSALYMATLVHPMIAMASPAVPIVLGVLGLSSGNPSEMLFAAPMRGWERGQPIGLKNLGANCWVNAAFQVCAFKFLDLFKQIEQEFSNKDAGRKEVSHFTKVYPLLMAVERYREEIKGDGTRRISSVDSQQIRKWLSSIYPEVPLAASEQWDAMVFFDAFLGGVDYALPLTRRTDRLFPNGILEKGEENPYQGSHSLVLNLKKGGENRFMPLFNECFEDSFEDTVGMKDIRDPKTLQKLQNSGATTITAKHIINTWFSKAPDSFLIQARRFNKEFDKQGNMILGEEKLTDRVDFPMELSLSKAHCPSEQRSYIPDAIVIHSGTIAGGHYYGYVRREDGKWYEVNDSHTREVDESMIKAEIPNAYIVHYSKQVNAS